MRREGTAGPVRARLWTVALLVASGAVPLRAAAEPPHHAASLALFYPISTNRDPDLYVVVEMSALYGRVGSVRSLGLNGVACRVSQDAHGLQITGLYSRVGDEVRGVQLTGAINDVAGAVRGVQLAGGWNRTRSQVFGAQIGLVNEAVGSRGAQIGVVNLSQGAGGVQIGAVNQSGAGPGCPIGLVNLARGGAVEWVLYGTTLTALNLGVRTTARRFYSILSAGMPALEEGAAPALVLSWSYGYAVHAGERSSVGLDLGFAHYVPTEVGAPGENDALHFALQVRALLEHRLGSRWSAFVGAGVGRVYSEYSLDSPAVTRGLFLGGVALR